MNNKNIESIKKLITPYELKNQLNLKYEDRIFIEDARIKINDIIFVHAGIVPEIVKETKQNTIKYVNLLMKNFFDGSTGVNDNINKFLIDSKGVLWDRSLGKDNTNCDIIDKTLKDLDCNHIVIGHTPQNIINSRCNEKVWRVDVGLSKSLGNNNFQILEIKRNDNKSSFRILS